MFAAQKTKDEPEKKIKFFFYKSNWGFYTPNKDATRFECGTIINRMPDGKVKVFMTLTPSQNIGSVVRKETGAVSYGYYKLGISPFHGGTRSYDVAERKDGSFVVNLEFDDVKQKRRKYTRRSVTGATKAHPLTEAIASVNAWVEKTGATLEIVKGKLTATIRF